MLVVSYLNNISGNRHKKAHTSHFSYLQNVCILGFQKHCHVLKVMIILTGKECVKCNDLPLNSDFFFHALWTQP